MGRAMELINALPGQEQFFNILKVPGSFWLLVWFRFNSRWKLDWRIGHQLLPACRNRYPELGFLDLSGLNEDQLNGQHAARIGASYYRRIGDLTLFPAFAGISVFRWDINIRESTVLGLVGAGGIGLQLDASISNLAWTQVSLILLAILATVVVSEWVSAKVRHAII